MSPLAKGLLVLFIVGSLVSGWAQDHRINELERDQVPYGLVDSNASAIVDLQNAVATIRNQQLSDQRAYSASVTKVPAVPYCNLHDIYVHNPGC